ncbi:hypothetical protein GLOIN_2v1525871 [Rhizophagus clarus]|uniref:Uncharacterized protein n=1 Tax=Rhizophagus clarus TaxID=94130 RepID=A0A8H3LIN8_9GLOM|nr:hypothetical protein GLOIN_2v1525871 [Rhizophagus clarus]
MFYIVEIILIMNLLLGATITLELWKILKNNYEIDYYSWGKKDYKLWLMVIVISVMFEFADQYSILFVFCCQWALIILCFVLRRITVSFYIAYIYILAIAIGGLCNIIVFIRNEGIFFNLGSNEQEETQEINDPENGRISPTESKQEHSFAETISE